MTTAPGYTFAEKRQRIFAIIAASSGNLVEWFDFYVYAFCAVYFAPSFFPKSDPTTQLLNTAGVFAAGFLMRPIGGWLFGRIADRNGRKTAMVTSVTLMCLGSLIIACLVKSRERFMGVGQVLTMPLFFASSAIYPLSMMPDWLKVVARVNPLTYLVDAMRTLMIHGAQSVEGLPADFAVMMGFFVVFVCLATRLYPNLVRKAIKKKMVGEYDKYVEKVVEKNWSRFHYRRS